MFLSVLNFIINAGEGASGNVNYFGSQHWVYWLLGALFLVGALVLAYLTYRCWDKTSHEHLYHTYGEFKKFWYKNRQGILILLTLIVFLCSIFFFLMNGVIIK